MHPELIHIGPITVYSYGTMIAVAIVVAVALVWRQAWREGIDREITLDFTLGLVLAGLVGSRVVYVVLNWRTYIGDPLAIIGIGAGGCAQQGLTIHGGLLGGLVAGWLMARHYRLGFWALADLYARALAIGLGIGRIGCLLAGCCYGQLTDGSWGCPTVFAPGLRQPSQIYETAMLTVLFILLSRFMLVPRRRGQLFGLFVAGYGVARFVAEIYRESERVFAGLSLAQLVSIGLLLLGLAVFYTGRARPVVTPLPRPGAGQSPAIIP